MKYIILFTFTLLHHLCLAQSSEFSLDGNWYQCLVNGNYKEYKFNNNTIVIRTDTDQWEYRYQLNNDTLIYIMEEYNDWGYIGVISNYQDISELTLKQITPEFDPYFNESKLVKFNEELLQHTFNKRKRIQKCRDVRTKEQKQKEKLLKMDAERRIRELEQKLDSLANLNQN